MMDAKKKPTLYPLEQRENSRALRGNFISLLGMGFVLFGGIAFWAGYLNSGVWQGVFFASVAGFTLSLMTLIFDTLGRISDRRRKVSPFLMIVVLVFLTATGITHTLAH